MKIVESKGSGTATWIDEDGNNREQPIEVAVCIDVDALGEALNSYFVESFYEKKPPFFGDEC